MTTNRIRFFFLKIFLYEFDGRETVKRPHHCLPFAVVSLIQDGLEKNKFSSQFQLLTVIFLFRFRMADEF